MQLDSSTLIFSIGILSLLMAFISWTFPGPITERDYGLKTAPIHRGRCPLPRTCSRAAWASWGWPTSCGRLRCSSNPMCLSGGHQSMLIVGALFVVCSTMSLYAVVHDEQKNEIAERARRGADPAQDPAAGR